jgi:hypothetical protein
MLERRHDDREYHATISFYFFGKSRHSLNMVCSIKKKKKKAYIYIVDIPIKTILKILSNFHRKKKKV